MSRDTRAALDAALAEPVTDWINDPQTRIIEGPAAKIVYSARMPPEWSDEIAAETIRRGLDNPNELIRALVREGLDRAAA